MNESEVVSMLERSGAILRGHFQLSSGRHSDIYVEKFRALEQPFVARDLGIALAERLKEHRPDVVLAPAVGAVVLGFVTALALDARSIFAERQDGQMTLRRGFEIRPGERVVVVEDVITTGKSLNEVLALVPAGQLVGIGCLVDRGPQDLVWPVPLSRLARVQAQSWVPDDCPSCADGLILTERGSRSLHAGS